MTTTQDFDVTGLTCGHCVSAVTEEIGALPSVVAVAVELRSAGTSTVSVTSAAGVTDADVDAALDEAGDYHRATAPSPATP